MDIIPHKVLLKHPETGLFHCGLLTPSPRAGETARPGEFCTHQCFYVDLNGYISADDAWDVRLLDKEPISSGIIIDWDGNSVTDIVLPLRVTEAEPSPDLEIWEI